MGGLEMNEKEEIMSGMVESIGHLLDMQEEDNDRKAVALYRAMFANEKDINSLDFNYADHILGYAEFGCQKAVIDYKNYLNYLRTIVPEEYPSHLRMFEESMERRNREDEENE